jgi:hypothetical protein
MAQFEADLADENAEEEDVTEEKSSNKEGGEEAWLKSDRDYSYDEVGNNSIYIQTYTNIIINSFLTVYSTF